MRHYILVLLLGFSSAIFAQSIAIRIKDFNLEKGLAIQGYDPVAYFASNKAILGISKFNTTCQGVTYYFYSQANKNKFIKNPVQYKPQYGGWCAFAMGDSGNKVEIDPKTFKIIDGKLYLFYNAYFNNTLKSWNKDEKNLKTKADKNWTNIIKN